MRGWLVVTMLTTFSTGDDGHDAPRGIDAFNRGVDAMGRQAYDMAEEEFKRALAANPELAEAHLNLGMLELDLGLLDDARRETDVALSLFERHRRALVAGTTPAASMAIAHNNLGTIALREARFDEAIAHYRTALRLDPQCTTALANMEMMGLAPVV